MKKSGDGGTPQNTGVPGGAGSEVCTGAWWFVRGWESQYLGELWGTRFVVQIRE